MTPTDWLGSITGAVAAPVWRKVDEMRAVRGAGLPDWPEWCFLPFGGWYAIASMALGKERLSKDDVPLMQALAVAGTWRVTQDIVRFDETLYQSLVETPVDGNLPSKVLTRLPAWCVYIETPGMAFGKGEILGVWAMLEHDVNGYGDELRLFAFDGGIALLPIVLQIGDWTVEDALSRPLYTDALREITHPSTAKAGADALVKVEAIPQIISLLLYICTYGFPRQDGMAPLEHPAYPKSKKTKQGWRLFPAQRPTVRIVGESIGRKIREAEAQDAKAPDRESSTHASPRPHIRRGHWHGFWHGPRDGERQLKLQWLPPIPVAMGNDGED